MQIAYGNNYRRKRSHQPQTYVCLDYRDSRRAHSKFRSVS
jgi:hypothetical protein